MKNWQPVDVIVFALALVIALVLLSYAAGGWFLDPSEHKAELIEDICQSALAVVALYVGSKLPRKQKPPPN